MLKANYHTHVVLCGHAVGMTEDYVTKAISLGYTSLGMSDHGPIGRNMMSPAEFDKNWLNKQMDLKIFEEVYLPDVLAAKDKYKKEINVYVGLEIEYIPEYHEHFAMLRSKLDYLNYAGHFFYHEGKNYNGFEEVTYKNVAGYAQTAKKAIESGLYAMMVHPDVFMHKYKDVNGENKWDEHCEAAAKVIIEAAVENNVYLEINCGGLYKVTAASAQPGEYGYPRRQFWELASKYKDLNVVIGADAHDPKQLEAKEINIARELAKKLNITVQDFCMNIEKTAE